MFLEIAQYSLVCSLGLAISLWVPRGGVVDLDSPLRAKSFKLVRNELWSIVNNYLVWDAMTTYNILPNESFHRQILDINICFSFNLL